MPCLRRRCLQGQPDAPACAHDHAGRRHDEPDRVPTRSDLSGEPGSSRGSSHSTRTTSDVLRRVATSKVPWFPSDELPLDMMVHGSRLGPKGVTRVHHLWIDRALAALAVMWSYAHEEADPRVRNALLFWVEQAFWGLSLMNRYRPDGFSQVSQFQSGVFYIPSLHAEPSPRYNLEGSSPVRGKRATLVKYWKASPAVDGLVRISTGSSERIALPDDSVDYVFVDPPFGANIPYSDLALVLESWHGVMTDMGSEATMDSFKHRGLPEYTSLMSDCFREFYRVLQPWSVDDSRVQQLGQQRLARDPAGPRVGRVCRRRHPRVRQGTALVSSGHGRQRGEAGPDHLGLQAAR